MHSKYFVTQHSGGLEILTLSWQGYKNGLSGRGGASNAPPGNKAKIKLQRHVRSLIRGFWGCQTHLDYCQVSYMCGYTHVILYQGCQDQNSDIQKVND